MKCTRRIKMLYQLALAAVRKIRLVSPVNQQNERMMLELIRAVDATLLIRRRGVPVMLRGLATCMWAARRLCEDGVARALHLYTCRELLMKYSGNICHCCR